jgi:hypothetical protein
MRKQGLCCADLPALIRSTSPRAAAGGAASFNRRAAAVRLAVKLDREGGFRRLRPANHGLDDFSTLYSHLAARRGWHYLPPAHSSGMPQ